MRRYAGVVLAAEGFSEVISFPFVSQAEFDKLRVPEGDARRHLLALANPLSAEEPYLTTTLLPGLLKIASRNVGLGNSEVSLFEIATVTLPTAVRAAPIYKVSGRPSEGEYDELLKSLPDQPWHVGVVASGDFESAGWWGEGRLAAWHDAVAAVSAVADSLNVNLTVRPAAVEPWHPGRCAELLVGAAVVGHAGELHPKVCEAYGLPVRSAAAEFNLDLLIQHAQEVVRPPEVSSYPVAKEDVAVVVNDSVPAVAVEAALADGAGELLESIRLFDVYTGPQLGEGKKSLAFALRFRAFDRTLTEGESAAARDAAVAQAAELYGAEQRR
jgi:phenylalanyl-tRNA synthetase beta chain